MMTCDATENSKPLTPLSTSGTFALWPVTTNQPRKGDARMRPIDMTFGTVTNRFILLSAAVSPPSVFESVVM